MMDGQSVTFKVNRSLTWLVSVWPCVLMMANMWTGSDIMLEMYQSGELQELIEIAAAS